MEISWKSIVLNKIITTFLVVWLYNPATSQQLELKDSVLLSGVQKLQFDADGNLYVLQNKKFYKISPDRISPLSFQLERDINNFYVQTKYKIFLFTETSVLTLNQQLIPIGEEIHLNATPLAAEQQQTLFLYDFYSQILSKKDLLTNQNLLSVKLNQHPVDIEYIDKKLYILFSNHVAVYDDFLNELQRINKPAEKIIEGPAGPYLLSENILFNPRKGEKMIFLETIKAAAISNEKVAVATDEKIYIYDYKK